MNTVYLLNHIDAGILGIYSSPRKVIAAARQAIGAAHLTCNDAAAGVCLKMLQNGEHSCEMRAEEASGEYDEAKTWTIDRWAVR